MPTVREIQSYLENTLPKSLSMPGDNDGFALIPQGDKEVKSIALALDVSLASINFAESVGAELLVTHHPTIFAPISSISDGDGVGRRLIAAARKGIALAGYHTRLDAADGGVNDCLCRITGIKVEGKFEGGLGRVGTLDAPLSYEEFGVAVGKALGTTRITGMNVGKPVHRIAVVGGSGKSSFYEAYLTGADTFLTGEVAHNTLLDARDLGMNILCATHYRTEVVVLPALKGIIEKQFGDIKISIYDDKEL